MYSRQLEQLARQRGSELSEIRRARRAATSTRTRRKSARSPLSGPRSQAGWALVSIGLRIAASGNR